MYMDKRLVCLFLWVFLRCVKLICPWLGSSAKISLRSALATDGAYWPFSPAGGSIVGVSDDPAIVLYLFSGSRNHHAQSEEDLTGLIVEDNDHEE